MQSDGKRRKRSQEAQEEGEQESEGRVFEKSGTIGQAGGKEESRASRACRELLLGGWRSLGSAEPAALSREQKIGRERPREPSYTTGDRWPRWLASLVL